MRAVLDTNIFLSALLSEKGGPAFIVEAWRSGRFDLVTIREKVAAEAMRAKFHAEGKRRLARMNRSGLGIPADEVFAYLEQRALGKRAVPPKARRIA